MANPQLEDGHTRIANELLDKLVQLHLSPNQWQILFFVIRKTYGYRKKVDYITNTQIVHGTGIHKAHVSRAMSNLVGRKILTRNGKLIGLQKDYEGWQELPELVTKVTSSLVTQKKKETIQKKLYKRNYGEFQNVLLTNEEYQKLKDQFGNAANGLIEKLSIYIASRGKRYQSHYATILNWQRRDKDGKAKNRGLPKTYTPSPNDEV